jgi:hypothetical protein
MHAAKPTAPAKPIHVGSRVRIVSAAALVAALRWPAERRPEPGQMAWAGRHAFVTGHHLGIQGRSAYVLQGAPGLWAGEWLEPV